MKYFKKEIVNDKKTEAVINEEGEIINQIEDQVDEIHDEIDNDVEVGFMEEGFGP